MRAIHEFGQEILSKWLQCKAKFIEGKKLTELDQYDLFGRIIKGSDNIANHAIGIYNNWTFDSNESVATPLCQKGLDYCVSTKGIRNQFVSSTGRFFFQQNSKKGRLKRRAANDTSFDSTMTKKGKKIMDEHFLDRVAGII